MKHALVVALFAAVLTSCAHQAPPKTTVLALDCIFYNPITNTCSSYAPEPPPGGRKCDWRGNTTINSGEFAAYSSQGYWCVTMPGGDYPDMAAYFFGFGGPAYVVNRRTSWPAPPGPSYGYAGTYYTGSVTQIFTGTSQSTPVLRSLRVR